MIKQSSFQLMDAVRNCWSNTVGHLVTEEYILNVYIGSINMGHQPNLFHVLMIQ